MSEARSWAWVLLLGGTLAVLSSVDSANSALWWLLTTAAAWVWGLRYVPWIVGGLVVVAALVVVVRVRRGRVL